MACLNLTNGNFVALNWSNAANTPPGGVIIGDVTIQRNATQINIQKTGSPAPLLLNGDFRYVVYGPTNFIAILRLEPFGGDQSRTVSIVDITGSNLGVQQVLQVTVPTGKDLPNILRSPGSATLAVIWSGTSIANESTTIRMVRSEDGSPVVTASGPIPGINATPSAEVTASELIIHHPVQIGNDSTSAPRPSGSLTIIPGLQDFGEAVLGADIPGLDTVTRTYTLRNDGDDCITVNNVQNNAPFSLTPASAGQFAVVLDVGEEVDIDVVFAPNAVGNNITRMLQVNSTPANGDSSFTATGDARQAEASIATSVSAIDFGKIPHPGTDTETFTVINDGELDVNITILAAPAGSDFTWTSVTGQPLPAGGNPFQVTVTFITPGDFAAPQRIITVTPTQGNARTVTLNGEGCIANSVIQVPAIAPLNYGKIERGFRTVRFKVITNNGDGDLEFRARITAGANPAHAALFGLVLPDNDITDMPGTRWYTVLPAERCGAGAVGENSVAVAVSFFADDVPGVVYSANLVIDMHNDTNIPANMTWTFNLTAEIIPPIPVDAVLVLDRSGSMADNIGARKKFEAAVAAGRLFVQLLRDSADDRAAIIRFNENPEVVQGILPIQGNRPIFEAAMAPGNFTPQSPTSPTNIAGGIIFGKAEFIPHPSNPPVLKKAMIVLTDGMENRCFQEGGAGPWFSITGRDANDSPAMKRPDGTPQDSEPLPTPAGIRIYGIGLGNPNQIDGDALDALSTATGASYEGVVELTGKDYFLIEKYFTQIFMETANLQQIADPFFTINPGDVHEHEFDIFPGDVNAMVVLYDEPGKRLPFFIVSPKGEVLSGASLPPGFSIRFHSTDTARFAEFFFPHKEPERYAGLWKVVVRHEKRVCRGEISGDFKDKKNDKIGPGFTPRDCTEYNQPVDYGIAIGAGSNLRMQPYVEPGTKYVGESIRLTAVLSEAGLPVKDSTVKVQVESPVGQAYAVTLRDDGQSQDGQKDDGEYAGLFTQTFITGVYQFHFRAEGLQANKPYVREAHRTKTVYDKRRPPGGRDSDGGDKPGGDGTSGGADCCRKILRALGRQERLLRRLIKEDD